MGWKCVNRAEENKIIELIFQLHSHILPSTNNFQIAPLPSLIIEDRRIVVSCVDNRRLYESFAVDFRWPCCLARVYALSRSCRETVPHLRLPAPTHLSQVLSSPLILSILRMREPSVYQNQNRLLE